ncbi:uncharacterized protein ASPGLDRAFT_41250 [Aspergillus glaucus CBS 516.65]|uniref:Uncharacterized protein n=1 Tax=Aspergillus glaucus CBS 516.65 TaxID=1160497 RepID=A0A1L9VZE1_ASPGL|nr:hypothetical protein ASPGLDRAFT_41250 [Aspergillus glaucus CBS 516.65]OJJ89286.1 hypothetical protein ASPGLDRAFT_41250 [Aspergillus glaucus CBS 516.65]
MSSIADDQFSDALNPPQSAQPFQSLFGGPASQDVDLEPYSESDQGAGTQDQDDLDVIMGNMPMMDDNQSDATYHASDEDDSEPHNARNETNAQPKKRKRPPVVARSISPPSSPEERPNRFRGPESTWRRLTAEERQNAQALETIRARDLAAHLYNSYALRVRARERGRVAVREGKRVDVTEAFAPPKGWAAWPMSADKVPRADERLKREEDAAWTLRMPSDPRPSADLEESVIAMMLKTAKERFRTREWDHRRTVYQPRTSTTFRVDTNDESTAYEGSDGGYLDDEELRPVVQADDEKSRQQLRPISRNVLTQFDQLLMGLHHAQTGGARGGDSSASEMQSDTESMASSRSSPRKRNPEETERSQSRGRKQSRRPSQHEKPLSRSKVQPTSRSRRRSLGRGHGRSTSRLRGGRGLRDWSEVLGVAAITGWPSAVIMRTANRCSALFGEDMTFQKFNEGAVKPIEEDNPTNVQYMESESESEPEPKNPTPPPISRQSSRNPRSRASSVRHESTSRPASPATADNGARKGKGQHRKQDLVCPFKSCPRHVDGFSRTWNLNLHMKRVHPGYRPRTPAPINVDASNGDEQ